MNERKTVSEGNKKVMRTKRTVREHSHVRERADGKSVQPAAHGLATNRTSLNKEEERQGCYRQQRERQRQTRKCMTMKGKSENTDSMKRWRKWWTNRCVMNGGVYLALHQHGDVHKHVMQLLYAALQTHNVFVTRFNLTQRLFGYPWIHDLQHKRQIYHGVAWSVGSFAQFRENYHRKQSQDLVEMESRSCGLGFETLMWPESHQYGLRQSSQIQITTSQVVLWPVKRLQQIPQREHYVKSNMLHCYF